MVVLVGLLGLTFVLVVAFIVGPLLVRRRGDLASGRGAKLAYLGFFACLGGGFIIVEIALIQRFILFLGHPVYALTVVIFALLVSSALGSYLSGSVRSDSPTPVLAKLVAALVLMLACYVAVLPPIFSSLATLARPVRIVIAVVLIAPLGILMGVPMPAAIRTLARQLPEVVPWAWGINGAASVLGSVGALLIAILTGFNQALLGGAGLYIAGVLLFAQAHRRGGVEAGRRAELGAAKRAAPPATSRRSGQLEKKRARHS
jgi:hypothetical protein